MSGTNRTENGTIDRTEGNAGGMAVDSEGLFSAWLKRERKQRRLTQQQLGQQVSYSADQIRKIEADARRFGEAQARLLAELFGIPTDEIETFVVWSRGGVPPANLTITTESHAVDSAPLTLLDHPAPAPSFPCPVTSCFRNGETLSAPPQSRPRRASPRPWIIWLCGGMLAALLIFGVSAVAYRHGHMTITGKTVPGGIWLSPNPHFLATGSTLHFAAHACPARPSDPAIAYVNFTLS